MMIISYGFITISGEMDAFTRSLRHSSLF